MNATAAQSRLTSPAFEALWTGATPTIPLISHIPHDSRQVPEPWRSQIALDDAALARELLAMTDAFTADLFAPPCLSRGGAAFVNRLSRLVFDPERFESDEQETMSAKGMGAVYTKTSEGQPMRRPEFSISDRTAIIDQLFRPYAAALDECVSKTLAIHDRCLIIDGHSFPSVPLPYEDATLERPDLCLGYDPFHASETLIAALERIGKRSGWSVGRNVPFSGSYVPISRYCSDRRVTSIMIEVNRSRYMDEQTGEKLSSFDEAAQLIDALTAEALLIEAYRSTRFEAATPRGEVTIRVDEESADVDSLLADYSASSWIFITAWNPGSQPVTAGENHTRNRALESRLRSTGYPFFPGHGVPSSPGWEAEESFLALGVSREHALELGRAFGQNAVVWGPVDRQAILLDCRAEQ